MEDDLPKKYPSQLPPLSDGKNPNVMIIGAGLSGLLLAILLDRAGIPYQIYERTPSVKPLGSIISLSANIFPVFKQLGLYEELEAISLPGNNFEILDEKLKRMGFFQMSGEGNRSFSRPRLYDMLLSKVPTSKIHFNKKVLNMMQNKDGVMIRCADGTTYHGEILVAADGAYSAVRQSLFRQLMDKKALPASDALDLNKGYTCMVGTTAPLDAEKFSAITKSDSGGMLIIGEKSSYCWGLFSVGDNRISWDVVSQIATRATLEDMKFRNSEWGPESHPELINEIRSFKTPPSHGDTLGVLIDATPKDGISRVFLEDKMFETWHYGRTVLIGDAAHKLLPSSGQGAVNAMEDAVVLANCLYDIGTTSPEDINAALKSFKDQRYPHVIEQYKASKTSAKFLYGHTFLEKMIRYGVFNLVPKSKRNEMMQKDAAYRPQATFLPLATSTCYVEPQFPNRRYEAEQKANEAGQQSVSVGAMAL